jgi:hypothetical protein
MGVELVAVERMIDEIHENLPSSRDQNGYTLGRVGTYNIVVAVMPAINNNRAASVAMQLLTGLPIYQVRAVGGNRGWSTGRGRRRYVFD